VTPAAAAAGTDACLQQQQQQRVLDVSFCWHCNVLHKAAETTVKKCCKSAMFQAKTYIFIQQWLAQQPHLY
jgi:hypothetical protein